MFNNRFCYRIAKEAEVGWDEELKDYCEAYIETTMQTKKEIPEELKSDIAENLKIGLAGTLDTNRKYLEYIEPDEYDQYVED
ncbi:MULTISPECIES: hypothetical protein [Clostridium]|uniref:Uncharacterized protein n=2 Tax=Clostridium TaxID=1485 RepID=A0A0D1BP24_CLOBO|nr:MULTISPECIES: hypothetical protein [Clostridium]AJD30623.1 hypothetical protein T258_1851 [Clostridium botulinum Prevot_594]APF25266.1 hypothetical protein NPD7_4081 [Clostridium sporogenes]KEI84038.1 hypothetical protein N493_19230 [Clostridium botulinum B2 433]KIS21697.1 hypothetical protein N495_20090 [Clostridium botulinum B2 450]MBD5639566.1 hypothetical protein [Clostridium botulinum]